MRCAAAVLTALLISGFAFAQEVVSKSYTTPTKRLAPKDYPVFNDDYDFRDMDLAIERQLQRFKTKDLGGTILLGGTKYELRKAVESLAAFRELISEFRGCAGGGSKDRCYADFNAAIRARFNVFAPVLKKGDPRFGERENALFTAYATHPIQGSSTRHGPFQYPVYALPPDESDRKKTRGQIDFNGALDGKGLELFYANDLFDLYLLHIEGGGFVTLDDGGVKKQFYVSYNGTNSQKWNWISKYMMDKGLITNPSTVSQRRYLRENPRKHEEIFSSCPSYVYFKITSSPSLGSDGVAVTDGRSIATDRKLYGFKGLLAYIEARRPLENGNYDMNDETGRNYVSAPFSRFVLDQDTGGAIKGKARADIFFGKDEYALYAATFLTETGRIFFFLLK